MALRTASIIVILAMSVPCLLALAAKMRRHFGVDALENIAHGGLAAGMQRAVRLGLLLRLDHLVEDLGFRLLCRSSDQTPRTIRCFFSRRTGSPSGQASDSVFGR